MVGQFLRDFLFKNMITIQGDGHIAGRSDHVRDASSLGTPNTLYGSQGLESNPREVHIVKNLPSWKSLEKQEQRLPCPYLPMLKKKMLL